MFDAVAYLATKGHRGRPASGGREMTYACFFDCAEPAGSRKRKLYVNTDEGVYSCKVCGASGGSYTLQRHFGDDPKAGTTDDAFTRRRILDWAAETGAEMLQQRDDVLLYLMNERGLDPQTILDRKLGFVGDGWSLTGSLPAQFSREQLAQTGLVWKDGSKKGNDYFYRHLLIPVISRGHVIQIRGRIWGESKGGKYLSGPGEPVRAYNLDSLDGAEEVILTEGEYDCIRLHEILQASDDERTRRIAVVGLPGTNAWPDDLDDRLLDIKRIYLGFDSDEPGRLAAERIRDRIGSRARILTLPSVDGQKCDWTEFLLPKQDGHRFANEHPYAGHTAADVLRLMSAAAGRRIHSVAESGAAWRAYRLANTGLQTGWDQLDAYIAPGLLPGQVMFVLAKTGTGKTLLLCNMAYQMRRHHILFISLEMTREEVYHRLERIYLFHHPHATTTELETALTNIWICDENRLGEKDIAALVSEYEVETGHRPELAMVDYLGYYARGARGSSPYEKTTNAAMQLKGDAKAARLAVIAPAQVNRMAKDGQPIDLDDARDSVTGDTRVLLADGTFAPIADLVGTNPLLPVVNERYQYETRRAFKVWAKQERDVLLVRTRSGRYVRATPEHPLLTDDRDWQPISALAVGDRIAIPTNLPVFGTEVEPHAELLGMLIADGALTRGPIQFVKGEGALVDHVERLAKEFGAVPTRYLDRNCPGLRLCNGDRSVAAWLRDYGLFGVKSGARFTPSRVFRGTRETISAYLRGLFSCDGHVTRGKGVYYTSSSEQLARDAQHLLTRFGIDASLKKEDSVTKYGSVTMWRLAIRRRDHIRRFADEIGMLGQREQALQRLVDRPDAREPISRTFETFSPRLYGELQQARRDAGLGWAAFSTTDNPRRTGLGKGRSFTRGRLAWLARRVQAQRLIDLSASPLTFDEIEAIEPAGKEMVYDASVVGLHNFIGDAVFSNSGAIEETGDFVVAVFRPDAALGSDPATAGHVEPTYKLRFTLLKSRHGNVGKTISLQMDALTLAIVEDVAPGARRAREHNDLAWRHGFTWDDLRKQETRPIQQELYGKKTP